MRYAVSAKVNGQDASYPSYRLHARGSAYRLVADEVGSAQELIRRAESASGPARGGLAPQGVPNFPQPISPAP